MSEQLESIVLRFHPLSEWAACSRSSDSGVRHEVREREKNKEEERRGKEEGNFALTSYPTPIAVFFFCSNLFAPSTEKAWLHGCVVTEKGDAILDFLN